MNIQHYETIINEQGCVEVILDCPVCHTEHTAHVTDDLFRATSQNEIPTMEQQFLNVHDNHLGQINTASGKLIDFTQPAIDAICIDDIARSLTNICRFGGHTHGHHSVACHSILVAALAPDEIKLEALLHDAAEAYIGDVVKPLKNLLGAAYADIEFGFNKAIIKHFGLDVDKWHEVKKYDKQALELEYEAYLKNCLNTQGTIYTIISDELGADWFPFDLPDMFLKLFNHYNIERAKA